jgi:ubiquinone/menaquinone biosynthesis C-methylase UbiE
MTTTPDFSPIARRYARTRPAYPDALFSELASLTGGHRLAWDCATGNGQAAVGLAAHFDRVIATDISAEQVSLAARHPGIAYIAAAAEHPPLRDSSTDIVTVASAVHWFDIEAFGAQARRVIRPGGILAVWSYHVGRMEPPFDALFARFYDEILSPFFAPGARLVDDGYRTLALPGEPVATGEHPVSALWDLGRMFDFIRSWSGTDRYIRERGDDPSALIAAELASLWGPPETVRRVRWPLSIRVSRL